MIALKRIKIPIVIALAMLFLLPAASLAEPVGAFTKVEGGVDILRAGSARPVSVRVGDPVSMGDAVRTKRRGKAEIRFRDETAIQLAPESRIVIDEYSFGPGESRDRGLLSLFRGKIRAIVSKTKAVVAAVGRTDSGFNIKTPTAIAGVKGTDFIVYYQRGVSGVVFIDGFGFVYNPQQPDRVVFIERGQASFIPDAASSPTDAQPVSGAFVESHMKDMTASETSSEGDDSDSAKEGGVIAQGDSAGQEDAAGREDAAAREDAAGLEGEIALDDTTVQEGASGREGPLLDVVASTTTMEALTDTIMSIGGDIGQSLQGGRQPGTTVLPPPSPPPAANVTPPVTERREELIKPRTTPVTVNVNLP